MFAITRWDPFWTHRHLMAHPESVTPRMTYRFPLDVRETEHGYLVEASLPGATAEEVTVKVEDGVLSIRREIEDSKEEKGGRVLIRERRSGKFSRALTLPDGVDADKVEAHLENGVLTVNIPFAEDRKSSKEIQIKTG
jgi:HSP20 family protein